MISLTFYVDDLASVMTIFDSIQVRRYVGGLSQPPSNVDDADAFANYVAVSGTDMIANIDDTSFVTLNSDYNQYYFLDPDGSADDWYISRYVDLDGSDGYATSGWSDPVLGEPGDIFNNPQFPPEVVYGSADQTIIDRIRLYIGDPKGLRREYGDEALSSVHSDGKTYEMDEKGWPAYINMGGVQFTETSQVTVNGYRFLRFNRYIDETCITCSGITNLCGEEITKEIVNGVDIWYYTFRHSDREIMEAYDSCPPPSPLSTANANSEVYMIQTAIDLLMQELWEDATEDGAKIQDEGSTYDPSPGLDNRRRLLDNLIKRRDDLVKALQLVGITGVLID